MATATTNPKTGNDIVTVSWDDHSSHLRTYLEEASILGFAPGYWPAEIDLESMGASGYVTLFRGKAVFENDQLVGIMYENPNTDPDLGYRLLVLND